MFTGIIKNQGRIAGVDETGGDRRFRIETSFDPQTLQIGASVACSGCCLTVVEKDKETFSVEVSAESLSKTTLGNWKPSSRVNLETSLRMGDELGGHLVFGHVDGLAILERIDPEGDSHRLSFSVPKDLAKYLAPKGSVALDGISLTINEVEGNHFGVNIIPHTWQVTTMSDLQPGDCLNFEADMLARYVARMLEAHQAA